MRFFLFIMGINFYSFVAAQTIEKNDDHFSDVFEKYDKVFETLVVCSLNGSNIIENKRKFIVIGIKGNRVWRIEHYTFIHKQDSIVKKEISNASNWKKYIIESVPGLITEKELSSRCFNKKTVRIDSDTTTIIEDINLHFDVPGVLIEYKSARSKGRIEQIDPQLALRICPQDVERNKFYDFTKRVGFY